MKTLITEGVKISVEVLYRSDYSDPASEKYIFGYQITIANQKSLPVQLLRRHWTIKDSTGVTREVEGEGVIGEQPKLEPGQSHQYVSWCQLQSEIGKMYGTYLMKNLQDGTTFKVNIPQFNLIADFKLN